MPANLSVAVVDPFHPRIIEAIRTSLPGTWQLVLAAGDSPEEQAKALSRADVAFVMATPLPAGILARASRLRFIQKLGSGTDRIDTDYCTAHGIAVARLQAGNAVPVAEHTLMLILAAYRRVVVLDKQTRAGAWDKEPSRGFNRQLTGKTVGIVGFGAIGRQFATLLSGFRCDIVYFDPVRAPAGIEAGLKARYLPLDDLIVEADIVTLHLPLTAETRGLIDAARIAALKPDALVVNCARGGLVDETALAAALEEGRIFGAAIDAFAQEPPVDSPFLKLENTVVTPHAAGATYDNFAAVLDRAIENAQRFVRGEALPEGDLVVRPSTADVV